MSTPSQDPQDPYGQRYPSGDQPTRRIETGDGPPPYGDQYGQPHQQYANEPYANQQQYSQPHDQQYSQPYADQQHGGYAGAPPPGGGYQGGYDGRGGYGGQPPQATRPTSVAAVVGLVLAFLLSPIGLIVSFVGLRDTRGGRKGGRGAAVAGVIVGVLGTLLWVGGVVGGIYLYQQARSQYASVTDFASQLESGGLPSGIPTDLSDLPTSLGDDAVSDVTVDSCSADTGVSTGELTITNSGSEAGSYVVNLYAYDADGEKVGELGAVSESIEPGESATVQALGWADDDAEVSSCTVTQAFRS